MQTKTNNEITEGNILIAEFLGYKKVSSDKDFTFYEHPDKKGVITQADYDYKKFITHGLMESRGFIFHRSYDWLMPVVEKIESLGFWVNIKKNHVTIARDNKGTLDSDMIHSEYGDQSKIQRVFSCVVELIKYYTIQQCIHID